MALAARITSRRHPLVMRLRAAARRDDTAVLLDGPHLLAEALRDPVDGRRPRGILETVVVTHAALARPEVEALCDRAATRGIEVHLVPDALADAISPARTPTGVVALAHVPMADLDTVLAPAPALIVVVAGVQDPGNLGSIIRSVEAAGASGVVLLPGTADPFGWKALRGSMGSALRVPVHRADADAPLAVLDALRARGVHLVAATSTPTAGSDVPSEATGTTTSQTRSWNGPLALIVGAEGPGLPDDVVARADASVRIPLDGDVESLNVAVATALLLFELRRRRGGAGVLG